MRDAGAITSRRSECCGAASGRATGSVVCELPLDWELGFPGNEADDRDSS